MSTVNRGSLAAAITLALGVSHAHATTFNVTNTDDSGPGSLRQALIDAAADSNIPHTINLSAIAGQTINTTSLLEFSSGPHDMDLSIVGSDVTVASNGSDSVFEFTPSSYYYYTPYQLEVTISDLTVTGGDSSEPGGGIRFASDTKYSNNSLTLDNVTVTGNRSDEFGGGVGVYGADLVIIDSTITNNEGGIGGGVFQFGNAAVVAGSAIDNNTATGGVSPESLAQRFPLAEHPGFRGAPYGFGAGIVSFSDQGTSIIDSSISGNSADGIAGGGVMGSKYEINIEQSTISGNSAGQGVGAFYALSAYGNLSIHSTTISGNSAEDFLGGFVAYSGNGDLGIHSTTISGNSAEYIGGGILSSEYGSILIENSTISGNSDAEITGGLVIEGAYGNLDISFSTIVNNTSLTGVGGVVMSQFYSEQLDRGVLYGQMSASGSIISGNLADGQPSDLTTSSSFAAASREAFDLFGLFDRQGQTRGAGGSINVNYTLLGSTSPSLNLDTVSQDLLGLNPLLGPLANNGGPTLTHLPGATSPALNVVPLGTVGCGTTVSEDQRGEARPQDTACSLGSVDTLGDTTPPPPAIPVPVANRIGLLLMAGLLGLAGLMGMRRRKKPLI